MINAAGIHGYLGDNLIAGLHTAKFRESVVELDNATAVTQGYENPEAGLKGGTLTVSGWYDVGTSSITNHRAGAIVDCALFATGDETTPIVNIPIGLILDHELGGEVRGKIDFSFTLKTKFAFAMADCVINGF